MTSLKNTLKHYIYQRGKVSFDELEGVARASGRKISNMERRMREIVDEGKISPIRSKKGCIIGYEVVKHEPIRVVVKDLNPQPLKMILQKQLF